MKKIIKFFDDLITDRGNGRNSKIFVGLIFSVAMIVGLFVGVDSSIYNIFALCTMGLLGLSCVDNLTAPKITVDKTETSNKETKTTIDTAEIIKQVKKKK